jgi:hypothetical protein
LLAGPHQRFRHFRLLRGLGSLAVCLAVSLVQAGKDTTAAAGSLAHAAVDSCRAFSRKYFRRRGWPQDTNDADRFSSSAYRITWIALAKVSQPCS